MFKKHKILVENFSYLALLQIVNILVPLVLYPYLITHLGTEKYGLVVFAQSIILYLAIIINFGFNIFATKEVAINKDNRNNLSSIVSIVLVIKIILFLFVLLVLSVLVFSIPSLYEYWYLYYLAIGMLIYEVFVPIWYFQGVEKMRYITIINVISRFIFAGFILIFVNKSQDFWKVPMFNLIGFSVGGAISMYIIFFIHKISFVKPTVRNLKTYISGSFPFFIALLSRDSYVRASPIIVGTFIGLKEVAYFDLAEKILSALKSFIAIVSQTIYPKIVREKDKIFTRKMLYLTLAIVVSIVFCVYLMSDYLVNFFLHEKNEEAKIILNILVIGSVFMVVSNFTSQQMLIPNGYQKYFMTGVVSSMVIYFLSMLILYAMGILTIINLVSVITLIELYLAIVFTLLAYKYKVI